MGRQLVGSLLRCSLALCLLLGSALASAEWHSAEAAIMGTSVSVNLWHEDPEQAQAAVAAVMAEMRRIDRTLSPYKKDSELSRVNREAGSARVAISRELATILDKALWYSRQSEGAFDITFASLGRYYDFRAGEQPAAEQRDRLVPAIDYRLLELDSEAPSLRFGHPDMQIDLGGIAKGYAVDRSIALLRELGVEHARVSAGGDSRVLGDKRGQPWILGIKNPRGQALDRREQRQGDEVVIRLPLVDTAISTSGDYERYFIDEDGERVHHVLNPGSGRSAKGVASVSVVGPRSFDTDPLSTTVFVLGVAAGLELVNRLPGFDAVIIDSRGQVHYSSGFQPAR